jgi:hypothetical protein
MTRPSHNTSRLLSGDPGRLASPCGDTFTGDFSEGEPHGHGKLTFPDGCLLAGTWRNGLCDGPAVLSYPSGASVHCQLLQNVMLPGARFLDSSTRAGTSYLGEEHASPLSEVGLGMEMLAGREIDHSIVASCFSEGKMFDLTWPRRIEQGMYVSCPCLEPPYMRICMHTDRQTYAHVQTFDMHTCTHAHSQTYHAHTRTHKY